MPTLREGDVVILDNLSSHKSPAAAKALRDIGAWFPFLPPYSPDLNPMEMAFSKLKALIRKAAARTCHELWQAVGHVCDLFTDEECYNFLKAAGYRTNKKRHALELCQSGTGICSHSERQECGLRSQHRDQQLDVRSGEGFLMWVAVERCALARPRPALENLPRWKPRGVWSRLW